MIRTFGYICCLLLLAVRGGNAKEPRELFNGKDLNGWDANPEVWSVEGGAIVGQTKEKQLKHNEFLIWKGGDVRDFKLKLQYRIEGGNSGIQYRSKVIDPKKWIVGGYQADIEAGPTYTGILYEEKGRGILAKRGERVTIDKEGNRTTEKIGDTAELQKSIHADDWNDYTIEVRGPRMTHTINGKLMSETIDHEEKKLAKFGVLALQVHAGPPMTVKFRKIVYEPIESRPADDAAAEKK
jgi:Domain of Unknown Function (DUF1080)